MMLFNKAWRTGMSKTTEGRANIYENQENYIVQIEAPGFNKEDLKIEATNSTLHITGQRETNIHEGFTSQRIERNSDKINRRFKFREPFSEDDISAQISDGILEVRIPKAKSRAIEVLVS